MSYETYLNVSYQESDILYMDAYSEYDSDVTYLGVTPGKTYVLTVDVSGESSSVYNEVSVYYSSSINELGASYNLDEM